MHRQKSNKNSEYTIFNVCSLYSFCLSLLPFPHFILASSYWLLSFTICMNCAGMNGRMHCYSGDECINKTNYNILCVVHTVSWLLLELRVSFSTKFPHKFRVVYIYRLAKVHVCQMWKRSRITYRMAVFLHWSTETANHIPSLVTPTFRSPDDSIGKQFCVRLWFLQFACKKFSGYYALVDLQLMQLSNCIIT